jgi:chromosome partitioning protein
MTIASVHRDPIVMRTIAVVNQKGGCAKTTTAVNLAGCLALDGARVLVVDLDPQAHATIALGVDPEALDENLYEVLAEECDAARLAEVIVPVGDRLHLAPSGIVLSALEQKLAQERADSRTDRLSRALALLPEPYDYVIVDCPPNVGLLTFNAVRAAHEVIVPVEASHFALQGAHKLLETIKLLTERLGIAPEVRILATLYDGRTRFARETLAEIRTRFGDACFDTVIRNSVKLREAARRGVPIVRLAPSSNGSADYAALATEVAAQPPLQPEIAIDEPASSRGGGVTEELAPAALNASSTDGGVR